MRKIAAAFVVLALLIPAAAQATSLKPAIITQRSASRAIHRELAQNPGTAGLNVRVSFPGGYARGANSLTPTWVAKFTIKPNVRFAAAPPSGAEGSIDAIKYGHPRGTSRVTVSKVNP